MADSTHGREDAVKLCVDPGHRGHYAGHRYTPQDLAPEGKHLRSVLGGICAQRRGIRCQLREVRTQWDGGHIQLRDTCITSLQFWFGAVSYRASALSLQFNKDPLLLQGWLEEEDLREVGRLVLHQQGRAFLVVVVVVTKGFRPTPSKSINF